jgi:hypothetical protein
MSKASKIATGILMLFLGPGFAFGDQNENFSLEVLGSTDLAIPDGLPEGVNITNVNNLFRAELVNALANKQLTQNGSKNRYSLRYNITYLGHKWKGIGVSYVLAYNARLINEINGKVVASLTDDHNDREIPNLIHEICEKLVDFTNDNIEE